MIGNKTLLAGLLVMTSIATADTINEIEGTDQADVIVGTPEEDFISGLEGNDLLDGKEGDDIYAVGRYFDQDTIAESLWRKNPETGRRELSEDYNQVQFLYDYHNRVEFDSSGDDLIVTASYADQITIKNFFGFSLVNSRGALPAKLINSISALQFADGVVLAADSLADRLAVEFGQLVPGGIDFTAINPPDERGNPHRDLASCDQGQASMLHPIYYCRAGWMRGNYPTEVAIEFDDLSYRARIDAIDEEGNVTDKAYGDQRLYLKPNQLHTVKITHPDEEREFSVQIVISFYPVAP